MCLSLNHEDLLVSASEDEVYLVSNNNYHQNIHVAHISNAKIKVGPTAKCDVGDMFIEEHVY